MNAFTRPSVDTFQPSFSTSVTSARARACQVNAANTTAAAAFRFILLLMGLRRLDGGRDARRIKPTSGQRLVPRDNPNIAERHRQDRAVILQHQARRIAALVLPCLRLAT